MYFLWFVHLEVLNMRKICTKLQFLHRNLCKGELMMSYHELESRLVPQIDTRDTRPCAILIIAWGSIWGSTGFSRNQNNHGSSCAYVTYMYCGLSTNTNMHKTLHGARRSWMHLFKFAFTCVLGKTRNPQIEPMADDVITQGGIESLVSLVYICG